MDYIYLLTYSKTFYGVEMYTGTRVFRRLKDAVDAYDEELENAYSIIRSCKFTEVAENGKIKRLDLDAISGPVEIAKATYTKTVRDKQNTTVRLHREVIEEKLNLNNWIFTIVSYELRDGEEYELSRQICSGIFEAIVSYTATLAGKKIDELMYDECSSIKDVTVEYIKECLDGFSEPEAWIASAQYSKEGSDKKFIITLIAKRK